MNTNNLKIAWRAAWKSKLFTVLNVFGLAIGFAGFILAYAYINRQNSYDAWNPHYDNIYLIGLEENGKASDLSPAALAPAIKTTLPEVELVGRIAQAPFETPFISNDDMFYIKHWLGADRSIAEIFDIEVSGISLNASHEGQIGILSPAVGKKLFPKEKQGAFTVAKTVALLNEQSGFTENIHGISKPRLLSNFEFDYIALTEDIAAGRRDGDTPVYQTYIQVKSGTDTKLLASKINSLYQNDIAKEKETTNSSRAESQVYLDPLKNLHLRPKHGSNIAYKITIALGTLSSIILLLACINFANLMIVQAQKRSKEIGLKKVFGVSRKRLIFQFLSEVFVQCLLAAAISGFLIILVWNTMNRFYGYDLSAFDFTQTILAQLSVAVLFTTLLSGLYPAIILSRYNPLVIIKGNLQSGQKSSAFRTALLVFQFIIAFVFISSMLIISRQMAFIKRGDRGFNLSEVVHIKNLSVFDKPAKFIDIRNKMKSIPGILDVTVTTNIPGGLAPKQEEFSYLNKTYGLNHIGVDFEYFETLGMNVQEGRSFSPQFQSDTTGGIILNETAVSTLGLANPLGEMISICDNSYRIVGVVKDSKMQGFEHLVKPTAYTLQSNCGMPNHPPKYEILAKIEAGKVRSALTELEKQWPAINKKDGKYFLYDFVDQKYAALYAKQEQLQQAFRAFTYLVMLVALIGLFSMSAYSISRREKEVGIRKVLGANAQQILFLLNKPFIKVVLIAILFATPIAWWIGNKWLNTFAYRIELPWWIFAVGAICTLLLAFITISYQAIKASIVNPANSLRDE
ncbi:ABC transporter permease [Olivibacter domesticus]|uniref:Putative ABC transport system permease protein n=1 Tax=Olivibacter domesticus TaxID=407022 RepID=A0A1H7SG39_OLID1|nr:FtsX-like permease family protein [Olivibacter domesticus]SEL70664.1 putative ABC transport system permease protein [Olivibacter domesticus]